MRDLDRLLVAAGRSDTAAFAELYDALAPRVLGLALQVLGDPRRAEEVAEEAFLEMWRTASRFDPTQGQRPRPDDGHHPPTCGRPPALRERRRGSGPDVHTVARPGATALALLPDVRREAVELAYYDGRTHTEVGMLTQAPSGVAAARMRDGLAQLRDLLMAPVVETA